MREGLDGVGDRHEGQDRQDRGGQVHRGSLVVLGLGQEPHTRHDDGRHDRDIDKEDTAPPEALEQDSAHQGPQGGATRAAGGPDRNGGGAVAGVGEDVADEGEGGGHDRGTADAQQGSGGDKGSRAGSEGRHDAGRSEAERPDEQEASPTDAVGDIAHGHQQTRQGEGVDVTDPQQLAGRWAQVRAQRGDGQRQHRGVDGQQGHGQGQDGQGRPGAKSRSTSHDQNCTIPTV